MSKTYINVTYMQRHKAKVFGAKWDALQKKWYIPQDLDENNKNMLIKEYGVLNTTESVDKEEKKPLSKPSSIRRRRYT